MSVYDRLRAEWERTGIALAPSVDHPRLDSFEREHGVKLSSDLRSYLVTVGGMAEGEMDDACLSIHGFESMFRASDMMKFFPPPQKAAVVADFLIDSHLYVTPLDALGTSHPIFLASHEVGGWIGWQIAESFDDFLAAYLADAEAVAHPPAVFSTTATTPHRLSE